MLLAELRRRRLRALEAHAPPPRDDADAEERRAAEATAARLRALGIRLPAPPPPPAPQPAEPLASHAQAAPPPPPPRQPAPPPPEEATSECMCRICHGTGGRLFSPCACRGTTRFVHPSCLAAWRTMSAGRDSFYVCDVCGFRYNVRRAVWARWLESHALLLALTAALLCAAVGAVGSLCAAARLSPPFAFYRAVYWLPPWHDPAASWVWRWRRAPQALDTLVAGAVLCGGLGTLAAAFAAWQSDAQWFYMRVLPSICLAFANNGLPVLRMFTVGGLYFGFQQLALQLRTHAKKLLTRFGERVLDAGADTSADDAAAAPRDLTE